MGNILKVKNVNDYGKYVGCAEQHPLVCVVDYAAVSPVRSSLNDYSVYGIFFHDEAELELAYGRGKYDYKQGTVICVAPGQIGGKEDDGREIELTGWALLFHPDLLHGFPLEKKKRYYLCCDIPSTGPLNITEEKEEIFFSRCGKIKRDLWGKQDKLKRPIIVGYK